MVRIKKLSHNQVRYLLLPILALTLTHLVAYKKLPFEAGYQFPLITFSSVLFICIVCCELNSLSYKRLSKKWSLTLEPVATIVKQVGTSLLLTTAIFAILVYSLNYIIFGYVAPVSRFLSSLFVALLIIAVETLVYIIRDFKRAGLAHEAQETAPLSWTIQSGNKTLMISVDAIAYVYSQSGLVYVVTKAGDKYLTQFNSLNELGEVNDTGMLFKLNRQFMISHSAIQSVQKEVNQKLKVSLAPYIAPLPAEAIVSRYTSPEFKRWMKES